MPLIGLMIGREIGEAVGDVAEIVGAVALGVYGLYLVVSSLRNPEPEELDHPWALFGIPLTLSLDDLFAGASLGMLGFSPVVLGRRLRCRHGRDVAGRAAGRRAAARLVRIRPDLLSGVTLIIAAVALPLVFGG